MPEDGPRVINMNMTNTFNRELFMYSLGDIRFKKPISLKKVAYTTGFLIVWTLPMILIFGIHLNPFYAILVLAPPFVLAHFAVKPVFGGKSLVDWAKTTMKFLSEPKGWADFRPMKKLDKEVYYVESEVWISRRRELQLLADVKEGKKIDV